MQGHQLMLGGELIQFILKLYDRVEVRAPCSSVVFGSHFRFTLSLSLLD